MHDFRMSSIGSRLAGASQPQFGAGYPANQQYKAKHYMDSYKLTV